MFDPNNRTPRRGGYSQDANPREHNGVHYSSDGASVRPRFNAPTDRPVREGGRQRQRFTRTAGAVRVEKVERRPSFRPEGEANTERQFKPRPKHNPGVYSQRKRQEYIKTY